MYLILTKRTRIIISYSLCFLFLTQCLTYQRVSIPKSVYRPEAGQQVIVHSGSNRWVLTQPWIEGDSVLTGNLNPYYPGFDEKKPVHLYINGVITMAGPVSIPLSTIETVEISKGDAAKNVVIVLGSLSLIAAGITWIIAIIVLLSKGVSCPFIYVFDGNSFVFTGEIFSGAIQPQLERHDYLPLAQIKPAGNEYRLRITNEVEEIQHTNLTELYLVDHPQQSSVLMDKYGIIHSYGQSQKPISAINLKNRNITADIDSIDSRIYWPDIIKEDDQPVEGLTLTFEKPAMANQCKLIIRAKNSIWLDHMVGELRVLFGDRLESFQEHQKKVPASELRQWNLDQGIYLKVYVRQNNKWQYTDYFELPGPMAFRDNILPIDIVPDSADHLQIKLEYGFLFWEIDYAGLDFSEDRSMAVTTVPLSAAFDQHETDIKGLLSGDDDLYYEQPSMGDAALLTFPAATVPDGCVRSVFLHTKGFYEILKHGEGKPDMAYLKSFREPGQFIRFSKERFMVEYESFTKDR